jgi:hypothetical protein
MTERRTNIGVLTRNISDEMLRVMGLPDRSHLRLLLRPILWPSASRFAELAASFDRKVAEEDLRAAARMVLARMNAALQVRGVEHVPTDGPLLVASNHPGTVDGLAILAALPRRDLKVIATGIPFTKGLPRTSQHLIYVPREGQGRLNVVREAIRHLRQGGALLLFPGGNVEPDPALVPGAEEALGRWSQSIGHILRAVPQTKVLLGMVSGVLSNKVLQSPLSHIVAEEKDRQKLAEFLQVAQQMLFPWSIRLFPRLTFGHPFTVQEASRSLEPRPLTEGIVARARRLLADHVDWSGRSRPTPRPMTQA